MSFCPDCGTAVSEDTRFCPECGRRLAIGQEARGTSKKKIVGIIAACIVAIIVIVVIATSTPASVEPEPAIPDHFTTYTDELGLFSISYPPDWDLHLDVIEEREQIVREIIDSISSETPPQDYRLLFIAGIPTDMGMNPNVNIGVQPFSGIAGTLDEGVNAAVEALKLFTSDYYEFSRVKTIIDGRAAAVIEYQATVPGLPTMHCKQMMCTVKKTVWIVTCTTSPEKYSKWEDDFEAIVRSLRIFK